MTCKDCRGCETRRWPFVVVRRRHPASSVVVTRSYVVGRRRSGRRSVVPGGLLLGTCGNRDRSVLISPEATAPRLPRHVPFIPSDNCADAPTNSPHRIMDRRNAL